MKSKIPTRPTTRARYRAIQERYDVLYNKKRLRHDDVISQLQDEFFIAHPNTIYKILATDVTGDPNQLALEL